MAVVERAIKLIDGIPTLTDIQESEELFTISGPVVAGDVVYLVSGSSNTVAKADSTDPAKVPPIGIVRLVQGSVATVVLPGSTAVGLSGLVTGTTYWLGSSATPLVSTQPSTRAFLIGVASSPTSILVQCVPTDLSHGPLLQLIHFIDEGPAEGFTTGATKTVTGTVFPTEILWKRSDSTNLLRQTVTYTGAFPTVVEWKLYAADGSTVVSTVTDTITYSGPFEASRTRSIV